MASIKGQNLRVFLDGKPMSLATNCTVNIQHQTESSSTKDDTGAWDKVSVVGASWDITFEMLYQSAADAAAQTFSTLLTIIKSLASKSVSFDKADGTNNRTPQEAGYAITGDAYLTSLTLQSDNRQNVTISGTLTGAGPLTQQT